MFEQCAKAAISQAEAVKCVYNTMLDSIEWELIPRTGASTTFQYAPKYPPTGMKTERLSATPSNWPSHPR